MLLCISPLIAQSYARTHTFTFWVQIDTKTQKMERDRKKKRKKIENRARNEMQQHRVHSIARRICDLSDCYELQPWNETKNKTKFKQRYIIRNTKRATEKKSKKEKNHMQHAFFSLFRCALSQLQMHKFTRKQHYFHVPAYLAAASQPPVKSYV